MDQYKQKVIQHLGIVAGICNEIELIKTIDAEIEKPKRKVSVGQAVQSIILNALGLSGRAMYLHPDYYRKRPVDILVGGGIEPEDLNDDCLGSALDALYDYGVTELFYKVASRALLTYGIEHRFVHLDSTSFSLYGKYDVEDDGDTEVVKITKGYSKDGRPELNQVIASMMCAYKSSIPVWIEVLSGNSNDKKSFRKTIKKFREQFEEKNLPYFVADSAFFTAEGLQELTGTRWVTRVPETVKEAQEAIKGTDKEKMEDSGIPGYRYREMESNYAGIEQRWLVVYSEQAYRREYETLVKNIRRENEQQGRELWHLGNKAFACEADAIKAAKSFDRKLRYHRVQYETRVKNSFDKKGRPEKTAAPAGQEWHIVGLLVIDGEAVAEAQSRKGFFIVATNELDKRSITSRQLLEVYKAQNVSVERGFRFLKDPMFYAESLYLKLPKRIMALIMVMALSLLVYSLAERKLRKTLAEQGLTIGDQKRRPTKTPTIRWVFQKFEDVLILYVYKSSRLKLIQCELMPDHVTIIKCLGEHVEKMYFFGTYSASKKNKRNYDAYY
jgi:transposase